MVYFGSPFEMIIPLIDYNRGDTRDPTSSAIGRLRWLPVSSVSRVTRR